MSMLNPKVVHALVTCPHRFQEFLAKCGKTSDGTSDGAVNLARGITGDVGHLSVPAALPAIKGGDFQAPLFSSIWTLNM